MTILKEITLVTIVIFLIGLFVSIFEYFKYESYSNIKESETIKKYIEDQKNK